MLLSEIAEEDSMSMISDRKLDNNARSRQKSYMETRVSQNELHSNLANKAPELAINHAMHNSHSNNFQDTEKHAYDKVSVDKSSLNYQNMLSAKIQIKPKEFQPKPINQASQLLEQKIATTKMPSDQLIYSNTQIMKQAPIAKTLNLD